MFRERESPSRRSFVSPTNHANQTTTTATMSRWRNSFVIVFVRFLHYVKILIARFLMKPQAPGPVGPTCGHTRAFPPLGRGSNALFMQLTAFPMSQHLSTHWGKVSSPKLFDLPHEQNAWNSGLGLTYVQVLVPVASTRMYGLMHFLLNISYSHLRTTGMKNYCKWGNEN